MDADLIHAVECPAGQCIAIRREVIVRGPTVMLGDVADLGRLPERVRRKAATLILMRNVPPGRTGAVSAQWLVNRAQNLMPGLRNWLPVSAAGDLRFSRAARQDHVEPVGAGGCLRAGHALEPGALVLEADFELVRCENVRPVRAFRFDRATGAVRAARVVTAGEIVVRYAAFGREVIPAGAAVTLHVVAGAVTIERPVETIQSANGSGRVFVRATQGEVFAAPVESIRR